jgi:prenyltransferase beta subunit
MMSVLLAALLGAALTVQGATANTVDNDAQCLAVTQAVNWLRTQQQDDGGFPAAFGHPASITCDALFALVAAGEDANDWKTTSLGSKTIIEYLASTASDFCTGPAATAKLLAAIVAAGQDPTSFGGLNLVDTLWSFYAEDSFGASATDQAWALIAFAAARQTIPDAAVDALKAYQQPQGAWESAPGWGIDTNTTALAIQALVAAAVPISDPCIQEAITFYQSQQLDDGGFPFVNPNPEGDTLADANSTAYAIQALIAAGQNPRAVPWLRSGGDPLSSLLNFQLPSGAFEPQPGVGAHISTTARAVLALLGETQPLRLVPFRIFLPLIDSAAAMQ